MFNKGWFGVNVLFVVFIVYVCVVVQVWKFLLYQYLGGMDVNLLLVFCLNVINGGWYVDNMVDFQEFKIVFYYVLSFVEVICMGEEVFYVFKVLFYVCGLFIGVGDEGGFVFNLYSNEQVIELIFEVIIKVGYMLGMDVLLVLDFVISEMWYYGCYCFFKLSQKEVDSDVMIVLWLDWFVCYLIVLMEDLLFEYDWDGWVEIICQFGGCVEFVGDDIFCINLDLFCCGICEGVVNLVLIKFNQIGMIIEMLDCIELVKFVGYGCYVLYCLGEIEDIFIVDLVVGIGCGYIKIGLGCCGECIVKFNCLLCIEYELGIWVCFVGCSVFVC